MDDYACLSSNVYCYNVANVKIGKNATVSEYSFLCTATRNYNDIALPLVATPISIAERAWITADVFVGPGVTIGEGAVALARSTVVRDVAAWTVVAGNPARFVKYRSRPDNY